jgi:glycosyltransferase involved in cell wall biosynthesis
VDSVPATDDAALSVQPRRFLFMGRLHEKKRLDLLLDAWTLAGVAEQAELTIAGTGEGAYAERIIARCQGTPGVRYVGYLAGADRQRTQVQSTFGILTSLSEGQPLGVLESLACGRPCIVSSGCRMPMIAGGRLGWLADEAQSIAEAMRSACDLPASEYRDMAQRCRTYVSEHHDWHANAGRLSDLYRGLMQPRQQEVASLMPSSGWRPSRLGASAAIAANSRLRPSPAFPRRQRPGVRIIR